MALSDSTPGRFQVLLDGVPVTVPEERCTFAGIRAYLESLALQQQRILCWLSVDGEPVNLTATRMRVKSFSSIEAETMTLNDVPAHLIKAALQQTTAVRTRVQSALEVVLINESARAREFWWHLCPALKEPLLTLSLLPDSICGPANGRASLLQLRKWQLQQLGHVIHDVDEACRWEDTSWLSDALERRVLPWLDGLHDSLKMWDEMIASGHPAACPPAETES